jgi:DNA polymerase-3 subunit delta'
MDPLAPLLGNELIRERLRQAADHGRLHHCCLFEGPEGVGKHAAALQLALYVNCEADARPCGQCRTCRQMLVGSHPDLILVGPDPERVTKIISVDQAQALLRALQLRAHSARLRFVILDPADILNEESANTLLKTLEEPPADTRFILVSSRPAALLPTIRSRSQRVRFGPVREAELAAWLAARGLDPALGRAAAGSPGLALRLAEGEGAARAEAEEAVFGAVGQPVAALFAFTEAHGKKEEGQLSRADVAVDALEAILRDVVVAGAGGRLDPGRAERLGPWVRALYPGGVARLADAIALARDRLRLNVNGRVVLEALFGAVNSELRYAR